MPSASQTWNPLPHGPLHIPGTKEKEGIVLVQSSDGASLIFNCSPWFEKKVVRAFLQEMSLVEKLRRVIVSHSAMMTDPQILSQIAATLG